MKKLYLLRHAKAEAKDAASDFERVLALRGRRDMKAIAAHLASTGIAPDRAFVSPAIRTRETWELTRLTATPATFVQAIYEAETKTLLGIVRDADPQARSLILVGHNPGLEELAASLVERKRARDVATMPTGTLVTIEFDAAQWADVAPGEGRFMSVVTPADLGAGKDA